MNVNNFLFDILFDMYEKYLEFQGVNEEEFDSLFFDDEGNEISEEDYLKMKKTEVICEEVIDAVYCAIKEDGLPTELDNNYFINLVFSKYYLYNYDKDNSVIRFFNQTSIKDIERLFLENYDFGMDVLRSYYYSLVENERCEFNRKKIYEDENEENLLKFERELSKTEVILLNDLLRGVICNLYNFFISNGCDDKVALNNVWAYFINNFDPVGELAKMGMDENEISKYKVMMLGLIYADVYEDACNKSIIVSENESDRLADVVPVVSVSLGCIGLPREENVRNRILKHFILLQDEKNKKKDNRKKTYEDGRIELLKKVNPTYKLDELTF